MNVCVPIRILSFGAFSFQRNLCREIAFCQSTTLSLREFSEEAAISHEIAHFCWHLLVHCTAALWGWGKLCSTWVVYMGADARVTRHTTYEMIHQTTYGCFDCDVALKSVVKQLKTLANVWLYSRFSVLQWTSMGEQIAQGCYSRHTIILEIVKRYYSVASLVSGLLADRIKCIL